MCPEPGRCPDISCRCGDEASELPEPDSVMPRVCVGTATSDATDPGPALGDLQAQVVRLASLLQDAVFERPTRAESAVPSSEHIQLLASDFSGKTGSYVFWEDSAAFCAPERLHLIRFSFVFRMLSFQIDCECQH